MGGALDLDPSEDRLVVRPGRRQIIRQIRGPARIADSDQEAGVGRGHLERAFRPFESLGEPRARLVGPATGGMQPGQHQDGVDLIGLRLQGEPKMTLGLAVTAHGPGDRAETDMGRGRPGRALHQLAQGPQRSLDVEAHQLGVGQLEVRGDGLRRIFGEAAEPHRLVQERHVSALVPQPSPHMGGRHQPVDGFGQRERVPRRGLRLLQPVEPEVQLRDSRVHLGRVAVVVERALELEDGLFEALFLLIQERSGHVLVPVRDRPVG